MATYTIDTHATIRELEAAGMDSKQAEVVVAAISRSDAELATKADPKAESGTIRAEIAGPQGRDLRALWIQGAGIVALDCRFDQVALGGQIQHPQHLEFDRTLEGAELVTGHPNILCLAELQEACKTTTYREARLAASRARICRRPISRVLQVVGP